MFQYVVGCWEVGKRSIVNVINELSDRISKDKKLHGIGRGAVAGRQR